MAEQAEARQEELGEVLHTRSLALKGAMGEGKWLEFLSKLTTEMGMSPAHTPAIYKYPVNGLGGHGLTFFQPITESFLALDVWPDHGGAYLMIASCKPFDNTKVNSVCDFYGLWRGDNISGSLRI